MVFRGVLSIVPVAVMTILLSHALASFAMPSSFKDPVCPGCFKDPCSPTDMAVSVSWGYFLVGLCIIRALLFGSIL